MHSAGLLAAPMKRVEPTLKQFSTFKTHCFLKDRKIRDFFQQILILIQRSQDFQVQPSLHSLFLHGNNSLVTIINSGLSWTI